MKILQKNPDPLTRSYSIEASPVSITMTKENNYPWLLNNFIALAVEASGYVKYFDYYYRSAPLLDCQKISSQIIFDKYKGLCEFICDAIDMGAYVYVPIDMHYIKAYETDDHVSHALFIYGYDELRSIYYIADNFRGGQYKDKTCTFDELSRSYQAFLSIKEPNHNDRHYQFLFRDSVELLRVYEDDRLVFEPYRVRESLDDYLHCRPIAKWNFEHRIWDRSTHDATQYGLMAYEKLLNNCRYALQHGDFGYGGGPAFHVVLDHKNIMIKRLQYMISHQYIRRGEAYLAGYKALQKKCQLCMNNVSKYYITHDDKIIQKLMFLYSDIRDEEELLLQKLMREDAIVV